MKGRARALAAAAALVVTWATPGRALADEVALALARAEAALAADKPTEAITELEALADRGHVDAALSFDRGLAYARRARSGPATDGDLGRAVHGFEEARRLTTSARTRAEAQAAITALRSEIAKRRSRAGEAADVEEGLSLGRSVTHLLPELAWYYAAVALSLLTTLALVARRRALLAPGRAHDTGQLALAVALAAGPLCLATTGLGLAARAERRELREGVIVQAGVRPFDARRLARSDAPTLPEGGQVRLFEAEGGFVRFRRGDLEGYLPVGAVLPLASR